MKKRILSLFLSLALLLGIMPALSMQGHAEESAEAVVYNVNVIDNNSKSTTDAIIYEPDCDYDTGFIFYPGGDVDYRDYGPLLTAIAQQGYLVISTEFPLDFAFLNMTAAYKYMRSYSNVEHWFIGGHSLGGSMAASVAALDKNRFDGVVLFASFSMSNLSIRDIPVLSIYGSNDGVLDMTSYTLFKYNIKKNLTELVIEGGNHAQFGDYGQQRGDNEASISAQEQVAISADAVNRFFVANAK